MPATIDTYGQFYLHAALDGQHFEDTKQKKYKDVVMCEIFIKGSSTTSESKPVFDDDGDAIEYPDAQGNYQTLMERYPRAWAAYNREHGVELDGTPLIQMGGLGPGQIRNLNSLGIETVEDLAELGDSKVLGESGMVDFRKKARAFLAAMNPEKEEAEKKKLTDEMEIMRKEMAQMKEALENKTIPDKPKRGRPKKEVA